MMFHEETYFGIRDSPDADKMNISEEQLCYWLLQIYLNLLFKYIYVEEHRYRDLSQDAIANVVKYFNLLEHSEINCGISYLISNPYFAKWMDKF